MKKILTLFVILLSGHSWGAQANMEGTEAIRSFDSHLDCFSDFEKLVIDPKDGGLHHEDLNLSAAVVDIVRIVCDGKKVRITGIGPGLRFAAMSRTYIYCTAKEPRGTYFGVKISADLVLGGQVGMFAGKNGVCLVGMAEGMALGASINASKLEIE